MKYSIETTDKGCIETLEMSKNEKFKKESTKTEYGCKPFSPDFAYQLRMSGYCEEIVEEVDRIYDGLGSLDFLKLAELVSE